MASIAPILMLSSGSATGPALTSGKEAQLAIPRCSVGEMEGVPYCSSGWCVQVDDAPHIWSGCVDGRVQAEPSCVHQKTGAALFHHFPQDVHFDLQGKRVQGVWEGRGQERQVGFGFCFFNTEEHLDLVVF